MNALTQLKEWLHAHLYGDQGEGHPSVGYDSKIERWREYPFESNEHDGHERSTTRAHYGSFVVCYCYDCSQHYRQSKDSLRDDEIPDIVAPYVEPENVDVG